MTYLVKTIILIDPMLTVQNISKVSRVLAKDFWKRWQFQFEVLVATSVLVAE